MRKSFLCISILALVLSLSGCANSQTVQSDIRDESEEGDLQSLSTEAETRTIPDTSNMMQVTVKINDSCVREYYQDAEEFLAAYGIENRKPDFDTCLILDYNTGDWFAEWVKNP